MIQIRRMMIEDLDQVVHVENRSFTAPWSRESFKKEIEKNSLAHYFVICDADTVIGYMGVWQVFSEGHITNVAIDPDFRGKGYSKRLIAYVIDAMNPLGVESFTLEVREANIIAIKVYESFGFKVLGKRKGYYSDTGEDALLMWLNRVEEEE
jgi:ribosomal-protein-alanine N-acetyltransferase